MRLLKKGLGVLDDAMPAPSAGCNTSKGATTVTAPINKAGKSVGPRAHDNPKLPSNRAAKVIPIP